MKNKHFYILLWLSGFLLLTSCNSQYHIWVGENTEQKIFNLAYGQHPRQKMDVFLPAQYPEDAAAVVIVHGGAWKRGKKERMIMIQNYLFKNNIPSLNLNYRLVKKGITYKDQLADIAAAIEKFDQYSSKTRLSTNNYIILGESAGGHLALLYGYENPAQIKKIISLSGPTDFYSSQFLATTYSRYASPTLEDVVGTKFHRKNLALEFKEASPIYQVAHVPTLLFQGDQDLLVNRQQGRALETVLLQKEIPHKLIYMMKTGHTPRFFSKRKREEIILPEILQWVHKKF